MKKYFLLALPAFLLFSCEPEQPQPVPLPDLPVQPVIVKTDSTHDRDSLAAIDSIRQQQAIPLPPPPIDPPGPCIGCGEGPEPYIDMLPDSAPVQPEPQLVQEEEIVEFPEIPPSFPGGDTAMRSFFRKNIVYPQSAKEKQLEGRVFIQMVVEKDGSLSGLKVLREVPGGAELTKEAIRVIKLMPAWIPAQNQGKIVRSKTVIPIRFSLE